MIAESYWEALIFSAALLGTPGPAVIALFSSGIQYGVLRTIPFFSGITVGFFINLLLSSLFIGGAFYISDTLLFFFKVMASLYMVYLAYKIAMSSLVEKKKLNKPMSFSNGILLNLINPKAYVAAFSSLAVFAVKNDILSSITILIFINITIAVILQGGWVILGDKLSCFFKQSSSNKIINITLALIMIIMIALTFIR